MRVRIAAQRAREIVERVDGGLERDARRLGVLGRVEDLDADVLPLALERRGELVPGGEGEVVHVVLPDVGTHAAGRLSRRSDLRPGRAERVASGDGDLGAAAAEVRIALAVEVGLVAGPPRAALPPGS